MKEMNKDCQISKGFLDILIFKKSFQPLLPKL